MGGKVEFCSSLRLQTAHLPLCVCPFPFLLSRCSSLISGFHVKTWTWKIKQLLRLGLTLLPYWFIPLPAHGKWKKMKTWNIIQSTFKPSPSWCSLCWPWGWPLGFVLLGEVPSLTQRNSSSISLHVLTWSLNGEGRFLNLHAKSCSTEMLRVSQSTGKCFQVLPWRCSLSCNTVCWLKCNSFHYWSPQEGMELYSGIQDKNSNSLGFHNSWKVTCEWELSDSDFISFYLQQFDSNCKHIGRE